MAYEGTLTTISLPISTSFAALQFTFVQINSSGQLAVPSGAGVFCDGVIQDDNSSTGLPSEMAYGGVTKVVAGTSLAVGDLVMTDSSGRAVTATGTNHILGRALAPGTLGAPVPVLLLRGGHASS